MSTLYLRGKSVWIGFTDQFGGRYERPTGFKLEHPQKRNGRVLWPREILEFQKRLDAEIVLGKWGFRPVVHKRIHLTKAFQKFLSLKKREESTVRLYRLSMRKLVDVVGDIPVQKLSEDMLVEWREQILKVDGEQNTACWLRHLHSFFRFCVGRGYIPANPITDAVKLRAPHTPVVVFNDEDLAAIFQWLLVRYGRHIVNQLGFLLLSGWRADESCKLTKDRIDLQRKVIQQYIKKTKSYWEYPMDSQLAHFMAELPSLPGSYVFHYRSISTLNHYFKRAIRALEIRHEPHLNVHSLRKQFAYNCHRNGVPVDECAKLLGHSSITTTLRYYRYWDADRLRSSLAKSRRAKSSTANPLQLLFHQRLEATEKK